MWRYTPVILALTGGSRIWEQLGIQSKSQASLGYKQDSCLKNTKAGLQVGLKQYSAALQAWSSEFKTSVPQKHQKNPQKNQKPETKPKTNKAFK
jgi:hypothetical protein